MGKYHYTKNSKNTQEIRKIKHETKLINPKIKMTKMQKYGQVSIGASQWSTTRHSWPPGYRYD